MSLQQSCVLEWDEKNIHKFRHVCHSHSICDTHHAFLNLSLPSFLLHSNYCNSKFNVICIIWQVTDSEVLPAMEFGMYWISSNKNIPYFSLWICLNCSVLMLQCTQPNVSWSPSHMRCTRNLISTLILSQTCSPTFLSKMIMWVVTSKCNSARFLWSEISYF